MLRNQELGRNIPNNAAETSSQRKGGSEGIRFRDGLWYKTEIIWRISYQRINRNKSKNRIEKER
jgi:hypothetical protein